MTNQTNLEHKIREILDGEGSAVDKIQATRDLLPPPLPDRLFGERATHPDWGEGIVFSHHPDEDGELRFMFPDEGSGDGTLGRWVAPSSLTFHAPDHPEFLETEQDYRNAPEGTIVAYDGTIPIVLLNDRWRHTGHLMRDHNEIAGTRRRVLRWRWGA